MSWILKVFNRRFERPQNLPDTIAIAGFHAFERYSKAGLAIITDPKTHIIITGVRFSFDNVTKKSGYVLQSDGTMGEYRTEDYKYPLNVQWVNNPVLAEYDWHPVYKEERENYVLSRAKNLSKKDPGTVFAVQPNYYTSWDRANYKGNRDRFFQAGAEITREDFDKLYVQLTSNAPERYSLQYLRRDSIKYDSVLTNLAWEYSPYSYSSLTVATLQATHNHGSTKHYTVVRDEIDRRLDDLVYFDGTQVEMEKLIDDAEGLIEADKERQKFIVPADAPLVTQVIHRWDLNVPDLSGITEVVIKLRNDLDKISVEVVENKHAYKLIAASSGLSEVIRLLLEE